MAGGVKQMHLNLNNLSLLSEHTAKFNWTISTMQEPTGDLPRLLQRWQAAMNAEEEMKADNFLSADKRAKEFYLRDKNESETGFKTFAAEAVSINSHGGMLFDPDTTRAEFIDSLAIATKLKISSKPSLVSERHQFAICSIVPRDSPKKVNRKVTVTNPLKLLVQRIVFAVLHDGNDFFKAKAAEVINYTGFGPRPGQRAFGNVFKTGLEPNELAQLARDYDDEVLDRLEKFVTNTHPAIRKALGPLEFAKLDWNAESLADFFAPVAIIDTMTVNDIVVQIVPRQILELAMPKHLLPFESFGTEMSMGVSTTDARLAAQKLAAKRANGVEKNTVINNWRYDAAIPTSIKTAEDLRSFMSMIAETWKLSSIFIPQVTGGN